MQWTAYRMQGAALDVGEFSAWFEGHKEGSWIKQRDEYECNPLHLALRAKLPGAVLLALLAGNTGAAMEKDLFGDYPLHLAVKKRIGAPQAVVDALIAVTSDIVTFSALQHHPAALLPWFETHKEGDWIKQKNWSGDHPLHCAVVVQGFPQEVSLAVLKAFPDAAKVKNKAGDNPLLLAVTNNAPKEVTLAVLEAFPDAAKARNMIGSYHLSRCTLLRPRNMIGSYHLPRCTLLRPEGHERGGN